MKTKKTHIASSIRFRRWSRAGYAVFCSLARTVTIGSLAVSISDKSLQKAVVVSKRTVLTFASDDESPDHLPELSELDATINQIREITIFDKLSESAAACSQVSTIYLFIRTVEMSLSHFNRFLFYTV
jgi:hypothetical protein